MDITTDTINDIMRDALNDPTLLSQFDVNKILETLDSDKHDYLENKTMEIISRENYEIINNLDITQVDKLKYINKLIGYRTIDQINELHKGKHVRWYRMSTGKLTNGGIIVDIKFLNNGIYILCMNVNRKFIQYKFDDCITFQKLSDEEQMILISYDFINKQCD